MSAQETNAIKFAAREAFGDATVVRLFGSRVDDHLKGGDIDLLIETTLGEPDYRRQSLFLDLIEQATDGKKVDLVFIRTGQALRGFPRLAFESAIPL